MVEDNERKIDTLNNSAIDRNSFEPAYMQLVYLFKQQVASGLLRAGDRLPSESQIVKRYQVSPMTVRRAINILADQGVVDTAQGRGTFVKPIRIESATFQLKALQDIFSDEKTSVAILEASICSADLRVAQKLRLAEKERVIYIRRLLSRGGDKLLYHREYLIYDPRLALVESELEVTSLRGLFRGERSGEFKYGDLSIEATVINSEEAKVLGMPAGSAAFNLEHIFYNYSDRPVSWGWFICRGDQVRFSTTLGIRNEEA
jgi:DNA-binding GntR family transcriptional regulator